jgi:hypothetical protein
MKASTVTKPGSAASVGAATIAAAKAPRKLDNRLALPSETAPDTHRSGSESVPSERANEVTAQGFAPAAPAAAGGESPQNEGASGGLPVPIASFTI